MSHFISVQQFYSGPSRCLFVCGHVHCIPCHVFPVNIILSLNVILRTIDDILEPDSEGRS